MKTTNPGRWPLLAAATALAMSGTAARADEGVEQIVQRALADLPPMDFALDFDEASFDFAAGELGGERVVKGAPYCADAVHETVQPLADGNRIVRKQQSRLCRDGEGRTRQEVERNGRKLVWLRDPVARQAWLLDPARKAARRIGAHAGHAMWLDESAVGPGNAEAWRAFAEQARQRAHEVAERVRAQVREQMREQVREAREQPPQPPTPVLITRRPLPAEKPVAPGDKAVDGKPLEMQVLRLPEPPKPPVPPAAPGAPMAWAMPSPPPPIRWQAQHAAPRGPGVLSPLGSKEIDGVRANGERTTWTIEAGKIGNEKPILITRDVWTSPELLLTLQTRDADPRSGETVYRLANLKRGEPDAALMKVPADYVSSGGAAAQRGIGRAP